MAKKEPTRATPSKAPRRKGLPAGASDSPHYRAMKLFERRASTAPLAVLLRKVNKILRQGRVRSNFDGTSK